MEKRELAVATPVDGDGFLRSMLGLAQNHGHRLAKCRRGFDDYLESLKPPLAHSV